MIQPAPVTGLFLSLEGVEGVGKSTNLAFIIDYLQQRNIDVVQTREPGGTEAGERIRELLLDPTLELSCETELLLMFASRRELVQRTIVPALNAGRWVVSDRFTDASFAYQGGGRGLGFDRVASLSDWLLGELKPYRTLLLDLPVEIGLERLNSRAEKDRIELEQIEFFKQVRKAYHQRVEADPERFVVIDASQTLTDVQSAIAAELDNLLTRVRSVADA